MPGQRPYRQIIDGVPRCPLLNPEIFRKSLLFRAANGDVVQSSFPKSGTHWIQYITQLIIKKGEAIPTHADFASNLRSIEYMGCDDWKSALPVRLLVTHNPLERETMNDKAKYIYIARNPWDVCVSLFRMVTDLSVYRFQDGTFEELFEPFVEGDVGYGSYFDHVAKAYALKDEPNVFFVTYEELKKDTRSTVLRLAHFLGEAYGMHLENDSHTLRKILEWSTPEHMRRVMIMSLQANDNQQLNELFSRDNIKSKQGYEGDCYKYTVVREAKVGSWRDYFTPEMLSRFEEKIRDQGDKASFITLWSDIRQEAINLSKR
ncbi:amine sulfotransferase-like [Dermacentor andersoni]|uniref:amine sulfotransferase-like n=1 Tax=Dermacentor andersoni TaxID=34620 RepID=UPI0021551A80|nr:amine sulfotransferase-like [Dermacentor andersoni]